MGAVNKRKIEQYSTDAVSEVKELAWTINNFPMVVALDENLEKVHMTFNAGESIGLPTEWKVSFQKTAANKFGIYIELLKSPPSRTKIFASWYFQMTKNKLCEFSDVNNTCKPSNYYKNPAGFGNTTCIQSLSKLLNAPPNESLLVDDNLSIRIQFILFKDEFLSKQEEEEESAAKLTKLDGKSCHSLQSKKAASAKK